MRCRDIPSVSAMDLVVTAFREFPTAIDRKTERRLNIGKKRYSEGKPRPGVRGVQRLLVEDHKKPSACKWQRLTDEQCKDIYIDVYCGVGGYDARPMASGSRQIFARWMAVGFERREADNVCVFNGLAGQNIV